MSRRFKHWSPQYLYNRLALARYEWQNPNAPWLTAQMIEILSGWLKPSDRGIEWGSGRSTAWLGSKVAHVTTIEDNVEWAKRVEALLSERKLDEWVTLHLAPISDADRQDPTHSRYVQLGRDLGPESLDFALVDGDLRDHCAAVALNLLKPGGFLIIDNIERYLPHDSQPPTPNARRPEDGCESVIWTEVETTLHDWRRIWTSNGVTETAFWVKPC